MNKLILSIGLYCLIGTASAHNFFDHTKEAIQSAFADYQAGLTDGRYLNMNLKTVSTQMFSDRVEVFIHLIDNPTLVYDCLDSANGYVCQLRDSPLNKK